MALAPIVALEVGTSRIRVVVGEAIEDGGVMVIGMGEEPSCGIRKGEVIEFYNATVSIRAALQRAEESADVAIRDAYLALGGRHIASTVNRGSIPLLDSSGEVSEGDIENVAKAAHNIKLEEGREIIHTVNQYYSVDDQSGIVDPLGMEGSNLGLRSLIIHGASNRMRNMAKAVASVPLEIVDSVFSGLCAGLAVLTPTQKESGVLLIDLGGGSTDILLYAPRYLALAQSIGVGGEHVTNDIAIGMKLPHSQAMRLKITRGSAIVDHSLRGKTVSLPAEGGFDGRTIKLMTLNTIINARMEETFRMIRSICEREGLLHQIGAGVVLTGGGAQMKDVERLAESVFNMPACIGRPRNVSGIEIASDNPEYAAVTGLLRYGMRNEQFSRRTNIGGVLKNLIFRRGRE
jgi:cell division protein FtsA